MSIEPKRPSGSDAQAQWMQWAHDSIKSLKPMDVAGVKMARTTRGNYQIEPPAQPTQTQLFEALTHAVWAPSVSKIYGCRGGYIFEFDSSGKYTGRNLAFADPYFGDSYLALDPSGTSVWASYWGDWGAGEKVTTRGFYKINLSLMTVVQFIPFPPPFTQANTTYHLQTLFWTEFSAIGTGPNFGTAFNIGPAVGDAFFHYNSISNPDGRRTMSAAPVNTDFYFQGFTQNTWPPGTSFPLMWNIGSPAIHAGAPGGPVGTLIDLATQATGRTNVIAHVPAGQALYINPENSKYFELDFGFTGTQTTTDIVSYLNNYFGMGPRRIGFGSNGHLYCSFLDSNKTGGGFGIADSYTGSPYASMFEIDPSTSAIVSSSIGIGSDVNGMPGVNCFWLDAAANDIWIGIDTGLAQCTVGGAGGYLEVYTFSTPWWPGAIYGVDYVPSNGLFYMVTGSPEVKTCPKSSPIHASVAGFTLPRPAAKPRNIRLAPFSVGGGPARLYIPTMSDNCVIEVNPATNTVTNTFTGFDVPWDIVWTDSKIFAIQLGKQGLKEVK